MTDTLRGILWMVATTILFAGVNAVVRHVGSDLPASVSAFLRYLISTLVMLPLLIQMLRQERPASVHLLYGLRGLVHGLAVLLWFFAMARLPLAEVTALGFLHPIYATLGAILILRERVSVRRWAALLLGFVGVVIILRPGVSPVSEGQAAILLAGAFFGASYLLAKKMTGLDRPIFVLTALGGVVTLVLAPFAIWNWQTPTLAELAWLAVVAALATGGHFTMTKALSLAPISSTQPVNFLQLVWASLIGLMLFGEQPEGPVLLGAAIVIGATSYIAWREQQLGKTAKGPHPPPADRL
jgi:drug/metabolite transporter (DMT)-like permease